MFLFTVGTQPAAALDLSPAAASLIGHKVWLNECSGTVSGLTSWNVGENFPSLGIGHFIWYPPGATYPFEESFPGMIAFLQSRGVLLPTWLTPQTKCPWLSREEFLRDAQSKRMIELRSMLEKTVALQTQFLVQRLEAALPKMLEKAPPEKRQKIQERFDRILKSGNSGAFALIDYVNFKGEGVNERERYDGRGWGLLQVLEELSDSKSPLTDFANSAKAALARRVRNSPPARHEERWLPGWTKRVNRYLD